MKSAVIVISKREWEKFMTSVEDMVGAQTELLKLVRNLKSRNSALKDQLRNALTFSTKEIAQRITARVDETLRPPTTAQPPLPLKQLPPIQEWQTMQQQPHGDQLLVYVCGNCKRELLQGSKYCDRCGHTLNWPA